MQRTTIVIGVSICLVIILVGISALIFTNANSLLRDQQSSALVEKYGALLDKVAKERTIHIFVKFKIDTQLQPSLNTSFDKDALIATTRARILQDLAAYVATPTTIDLSIPSIGLIVDKIALQYLISSPLVTDIQEDHVIILGATKAPSTQQP